VWRSSGTSANQLDAVPKMCQYSKKTFRIAEHKGGHMPELNTSVKEMVANARARIEEIETRDLIGMVDDPNVVIVDIRDVRERQKLGYIPGSFHCPRGMLEFWVDPQSPYFKEIFGEDKKFVFHCASGWRSALSVALLQDMGFEAAHLKEGFSTWEKQGGPVEFPEPRG
jgi:rhodanese-related sulfurtransferase